jgi:hypothetical protein
MENKKRIAVILGSENDYEQAKTGIDYIKMCDRDCEFLGTHVYSHLRHTIALQEFLTKIQNDCDALIVAAGWSSHPAGFCDAFLRRELRNTSLLVFGVALMDIENPRHTSAAEVSLTDTPDTQVAFGLSEVGKISLREEIKRIFIGPEGMHMASQCAIFHPFPKIELYPERFSGLLV